MGRSGDKSFVAWLLVWVGVAALLCLTVGPTGTQGWGYDGHHVVAEIAERNIKPLTKKALQVYLGGKPLSSVSTLPDGYDHTPQGKWSFELHFCNLPRDATQFLLEYCPDPPACVVRSIANYTRILTKQGFSGPPCSFDEKVEPCPLSFLTHFVGDIHQPLHVGYGDDEGGNLVNVTFFSKHTNLHSVWDTYMITRYLDGKPWMSLVDVLEDMMKNEPGIVQRYTSIHNVTVWADESYNFTRFDVYQFTKPQNEELDDQMKLKSPSAFNNNKEAPQLDDWYYKRNMRVVQQRLIAGGVRLATLLDEIFAAGGSGGPSSYLSSLL
ncbi:hypothetical protein QOT17_017633 [Balamuthia mandrillaris]